MQVAVRNNNDFIKKYGKFEFLEMCKHIPQDLAVAKYNKEIGGYKINNKKKIAKIYSKDKRFDVCVDFATIYMVGCDTIGNIINERGLQ